MTRLLEATIRPLLTHSLVLTERIRHGVAYNPFADAITQDPYPTYAALRARSPVHRSLLTHAWVLTRYADVDAVLRDHRRFSNDPRRREAAPWGIGALPAGPTTTAGSWSIRRTTRGFAGWSTRRLHPWRSRRSNRRYGPSPRSCWSTSPRRRASISSGTLHSRCPCESSLGCWAYRRKASGVSRCGRSSAHGCWS